MKSLHIKIVNFPLSHCANYNDGQNMITTFIIHTYG